MKTVQKWIKTQRDLRTTRGFLLALVPNTCVTSHIDNLKDKTDDNTRCIKLQITNIVPEINNA